METLYGSWN